MTFFLSLRKCMFQSMNNTREDGGCCVCSTLMLLQAATFVTCARKACCSVARTSLHCKQGTRATVATVNSYIVHTCKAEGIIIYPSYLNIFLHSYPSKGSNLQGRHMCNN